MGTQVSLTPKLKLAHKIPKSPQGWASLVQGAGSRQAARQSQARWAVALGVRPGTWRLGPTSPGGREQGEGGRVRNGRWPRALCGPWRQVG